MNNPEKILVNKEELITEGINNFMNVRYPEWKYDVIADLYDIINMSQCMIYINNKNKMIEINDRLLKR